MNALYAITWICLFASVFAQPRPTTGHVATTVQSRPVDADAVRFVAMDVTIDSGARPLAAYQFELSASPDRFTIVGVEGGAHRAFAEPPYYDPAALSKHRIVIAALNTGKALPTGKIRVARVHARIRGDEMPPTVTKLVVAVADDGSTIPATIAVTPGETP